MINSSLLGELQKGLFPAPGLVPSLTACRCVTALKALELTAPLHLLCPQTLPGVSGAVRLCARNSRHRLLSAWVTPASHHSPHVRCQHPLPVGALALSPTTVCTSLYYYSHSRTVLPLPVCALVIVGLCKAGTVSLYKLSA